jgi:hypothetical protein
MDVDTLQNKVINFKYEDDFVGEGIVYSTSKYNVVVELVRPLKNLNRGTSLIVDIKDVLDELPAPTPETDEIIKNLPLLHVDQIDILISFCIKLERERNEAIEKYKQKALELEVAEVCLQAI